MKFDHINATPILCEIKFWRIQMVQKFQVLNFDFRKVEKLSSPKFTKIQSSESLKLPKMTFLDRLNVPKFGITQNWSGGKIIKYQQSQALTSHFESFRSIVQFGFSPLMGLIEIILCK